MSYENFVQVRLAAALAADGVTASVVNPTGAYRLPPADGGTLMLSDSMGSPTFTEIVSYDSRTGNTLNGLIRGLEGTTARAWSAGSFCYQSLTAGQYQKDLGMALPRAGGEVSGYVTFSTRDAGIYGTYDSTKIDSVWSMGTSYRVASNGSTFGSIYGMAYKHTNNTTGGTMAGGHQIVFCSAGTPGAAIGLAGNIWTTGNITAYSDIRVKTNIEVIPDALAKVLCLRGVTYDRVDRDGERQVGVIAQEVQAVLPEAVSGDDMLSVAYGNMVGLLIEAIKDLNSKVDQLQSEVVELRRAA